MENRSMKTYTGRLVDPTAPTSSMISIVDISHGLSMQARWCGQVELFYSVAEHCVMVADLLEFMGHPELSLPGLVHDGHEAYTSDIPSPVKQLLKPLITAVEERFDEAIFAKFKLTPPTPEEKIKIKRADNLGRLIEDRDLRGYVISPEDYVDYPELHNLDDFSASPVGAEKAKIKFMEKFMQLLEKAND